MLPAPEPPRSHQEVPRAPKNDPRPPQEPPRSSQEALQAPKSDPRLPQELRSDPREHPKSHPRSSPKHFFVLPLGPQAFFKNMPFSCHMSPATSLQQPEKPQKRLKTTPKAAQDRPRSVEGDQADRLKATQQSRRSCHEPPKSGPRPPRTAPRSRKTATRGLQTVPRTLQAAKSHSKTASRCPYAIPRSGQQALRPAKKISKKLRNCSAPFEGRQHIWSSGHQILKFDLRGPAAEALAFRYY